MSQLWMPISIVTLFRCINTRVKHTTAHTQGHTLNPVTPVRPLQYYSYGVRGQLCDGMSRE